MSISLEIVDKAMAEMDAERSLAQRGSEDSLWLFCAYRLLNNTTDCETCGNNFLTVRISSKNVDEIAFHERKPER